MSKTIQIRNIDDAVYATLKRRAAAAGTSVPDFVRREMERLASGPSWEEWLERVHRSPRSDITRTEILEALDEVRGSF